MSDAICRYTGQRVGVDFTLRWDWGVRPSVCNIVTTYNVGQLPPVGQLRIMFKGRAVVALNKCRLAGVSAPQSTSGGTGTLVLRVEDRRWQWRFGKIDGDYNVPGESGALVREKTPQELARLLCDAMGETGRIDLSAIPNETRPRVFWYASNPAAELERLCLSVGCVPCLNPLTDALEIYKIGQGRGLPPIASAISRAPGASPVAWPDEIRVVTAPTLFQSRFVLEPMGLDTDGEYKLLDDLSYKPSGGWENENYRLFGGVPDDEITLPGEEEPTTKKQLALSTVYRLWRIKEQYFADGNGEWSPRALQNTEYAPTTRDDVLPIQNFRLQKDATTQQRLPAIVRGRFIQRRGAQENTEIDERYDRGFSVLGDLGMVVFSEPMVQWNSGFDGYEVATLNLECAYNCRKDGIPVRHEEYRPLTGRQLTGAGALIEHHDEIAREIIEARDSENDQDNLTDIQDQLNYYLDALADQFRDTTGQSVALTGLRRYAPSGRIRSIVWSAGVNRPPTTLLADQAEPNPSIAPWEDRPEQRAKRAAQYEAAERQRKRLARNFDPFAGMEELA